VSDPRGVAGERPGNHGAPLLDLHARTATLAVTTDGASNVWSLSAAPTKTFITRSSGSAAARGPSNSRRTRLYTFTDQLGTPILQTDASATITWRAEYEPFGNVYEMRTGLRTAQPLRFPGQEVAMNWEESPSLGRRGAGCNRVTA